jgi:hypothetical protein
MPGFEHPCLSSSQKARVFEVVASTRLPTAITIHARMSELPRDATLTHIIVTAALEAVK